MPRPLKVPPLAMLALALVALVTAVLYAAICAGVAVAEGGVGGATTGISIRDWSRVSWSLKVEYSVRRYRLTSEFGRQSKLPTRP